MIWFDSPAEKWEQALPIGNGRLGAMVYGGIFKETIALNQDSMWYGGFVDRVNPEAKGHLDQVRALILAGKIPQAERLLRHTFTGTPDSQRPYQPLGNIELLYRGEVCGEDWQEEEGTASGYRRELDLDRAIVTEEFRTKRRRIKKEYFASYPHGVIAIRMQALEGTISLEAVLRRGRFFSHSGKLDAGTVFMDGSLGDGGVRWIAGLRGSAKGGSLCVLGDRLIIQEAEEVTLFLACETSFYEKDWKEALLRRLEKASCDGYEKVRKSHLQDYRELYGRMSLEIEEEGGTGSFAALYFQYGRYLLISSSRPGSLPANLQGIWNQDMQPAWDSKFTININTEMNYWLAESCSLSECHLPLFDHLQRMWKHGKKVAQDMYGCRGFTAHHNTDLWGDCAPQDTYIPATYWPMGAAWLCTHIWQHYLYTQDEAFLKKMYPILEDAVLFFHDYLIEVDGKLMTCPSVSPENTYILPDGVRGCVGAGSAMDSEILRDLMEGYIRASELLHAQGESVEKTKEILKKLPPLKIGRHGQIMEWREDYEEWEPGHRHISQLYGLHPSHQITRDKTPELAEAARKTLERRLSYGGGHTGWSCAWIVNFYARLGEGGKALENLNKLWRQSTFPNLMDNHPRRDGFVFQIDGNFGAAAGIAEMLVQSDEDRTVLLPALPAQWQKGKITGVTLVGGAVLDLEWEKGRLKQCSVKVPRHVNMTFVYEEEVKECALDPGAPCVIYFKKE